MTLSQETVVNSASKNHQEEKMLRNMTERALKRSIKSFSFKELGGGMSNAVYLICSDSEKMVLKIGSDPSVTLMRHEKDNVLNEVAMLKLFNEKIDIPAPKIIYLDTSLEICKAPYFFMSYVEGSPLMIMKEKPSKESIAEIKRQVGIICRKISSLKAEYFGIPVINETHKDNNCDFILNLFQMLLQDASDRQIEIPGVGHQELLEMIEEERNAINEVTVPCCIHTDTWDGNLMIKDNILSGLIDYAAVLYGDPLMNHDFHDFGDTSEDFLIGYGKTDFSRNELIRISIYKIWQRLGMIVERGYRNYDDKELYKWVLSEFIDEIHNFRILKNNINF